MAYKLAAAAALAMLWAGNARAEKGEEFFEKKVRPILVKHCYECHASDAKELKGGLALDSKAGWEKGGDSGPAVKPGDVDGSLLIESIRYDGLEMPPKGKLAAEEIAILESWVKQGAPDPRIDRTAAAEVRPPIDYEKGRQFWAFHPPVRHAPPEVKNAAWALDNIDRFILAKLEAKQLSPSPDADRPTWLRRVTFDLTGLPPTPDEIAEFVKDNTSQAYAKVVERLLNSPHFGEHWGRHWLDVVRYADSNGNDFNATYYNAWRYRNYVVAAFNQNKPFDQFVREQIAGDLLPAKTDEQRADGLIATTFLMIGPKMLSERDKEKLRMDVIDEQIDTMGKAFLGLTLGCARCHDHKFDPIGADDYYALAGIFRSTTTFEGESQQYVSAWKESNLPISEEHASVLAAYQKTKSKLDAELKTAKNKLKTAETQLSEMKPNRLGLVVDDEQAKLVGDWKKSTFSPRFVGVGYVHDDKKDKGKKSISYEPEFPEAGEYEVRFSFASSQGRDKAVPVTIYHAGGEATVKVDQTARPPIGGLFLPLGRFQFGKGRSGKVVINTAETTEYVIADAVQFIPVTELEKPTDAPKMDEVMSDKRDELAKTTQQIKLLEEKLKALEADAPPPAPQAMAAKEAEDVEDCHLCIRGEPHRRGKLVKRGFLQVISNQTVNNDKESGRRELAQWLSSAEHPLTARVMVNRIWQHLLGEGLVRTVDNFGEQGERPTHPELLDTLTLDFIENDWSMKSLIRRIVLSHVYRQQAAANEVAFLADAENRLLWRANRRRLPAESIRDSLLAISGRLDPNPPDGSGVAKLGRLAIGNNAGEQTTAKNQIFQRSLYLPVIRNDLPELLTVFDFADPDLVVGQRPVTNVPAQSLLLLNSPFVTDCAKQTAENLLQRPDLTNSRRLDLAYQLILGRPPQTAETERALAYLSTQLPQIEGSPPKPADQQLAWSRLIQALLASTEFRMVD